MRIVNDYPTTALCKCIKKITKGTISVLQSKWKLMCTNSFYFIQRCKSLRQQSYIQEPSKDFLIFPVSISTISVDISYIWGGFPQIKDKLYILLYDCRHVTIITVFFWTANGQWNQWGHWSGCSKSCDGGWERRIRICQGAAVTGQQCEGTGEEIRRCSEQRCPGEMQI